MLYHVRVLEDLGEVNEALALLDICARSRAIVDLTSIKEYRGELGRFYGTFLELIKISPAIHQAWLGRC